jgi:hypothetical protein
LDESKIYAEILCDTKASQKLDVIIHGQWKVPISCHITRIYYWTIENNLWSNNINQWGAIWFVGVEVTRARWCIMMQVNNSIVAIDAPQTSYSYQNEEKED